MKYYLLCTILSACWNTAFSQQLSGPEAAGKIPGATYIRMNDLQTVPLSVRFGDDSAPDSSAVEELMHRIFGARPEDQLQLLSAKKDELGMTHLRFQQLYRQVEVEGNVYLFHMQNGRIRSANGTFVPEIALSVEPAITAEQAIAAALAGMSIPLTAADAEKTSARLIVLADEQPLLAYKCTISAPDRMIGRSVYIDALTGDVLKETDLVCAIDVSGTAHTQYSGVQTITTDQQTGPAPGFFLKESGRNIETRRKSDLELYADADNDWNNVNSAQEQYATDVHWAAEKTYDFFLDYFGLDSYDGSGSLILSEVNEIGMPNAYWINDGTNKMVFGDGYQDYFPFTSPEVVGHEFSHGVTQYSAGLHYSGESGALNESFSDIFGTTIRFLASPSTATWVIGDQLPRPNGAGHPIRDMSDPNAYQCPDTYNGMFYNTGDIVHYDSGVQNYWFYLLAEGGFGTNDFATPYAVTAIGLDNAVKIAYRNLAYYLTPVSDYEAARYGSEQAAIDLFGACSDELVQVVHAWNAVGVGEDVPVSGVTAAFTVTDNFSCTAPLTSQFAAAGNYASYVWDFGDGTTGSGAAVSHEYTTTGSFDVTLIVSSNNACQVADTLVVTGAITVDPMDPVAAFVTNGPLVRQSQIGFSDVSQYGPESWYWNFGDGATSTAQNPSHLYENTGTYTVQLTVQNCSGTDVLQQQIVIADYSDVCGPNLITAPSGVVYDPGGHDGDYAANVSCQMTIYPCNAKKINAVVEYIDLTGLDFLSIVEGSFAGGPELAFYFAPFPPQFYEVTAHSGAMTLYFQSEQNSAGAPGFKLTYTAEIDENPPAPQALFSCSNTYPAVGEWVTFHDMSLGYPNYWHWEFGDGAQANGSAETSHMYSAPGVYTVTLLTTHCGGLHTDTTMTVYVQEAGIADVSPDAQLIVAPNPFMESFTLSAMSEVHDLRFRLLDVSGREVYSRFEAEINGQLNVAPEHLSSGQYMLEAEYVNGSGARCFERHKLQK